MKQKWMQLLVVIGLGAAMIFTQACGRTASSEQGGTFNLDPNPGGGGPNFGPVNVVFNLFPTGTFPNRISVSGNNAYVVNSGSGSVEKIDLLTSLVFPLFIVLPGGSNPWEMATSGSTAYISNFVSNNVSVASLINGQVTGTITPNGFGTFNEPEGLGVAANGLLFVANADFDPSFNQGPGFVTVVDTASNQIINQIPTTQKNPQFVTISGNTVYITNSGAGTFDFGCGCFMPVTNGGVDIIDATQAATLSAPNANIAIPLDPAHPLRGFPGGLAIAPGGQFAYLGSNSGNIYKVDLASKTLLRGNSNPIVVTPNEMDNLVAIKIDSQGIRWVIDFNNDQAHLLNTSTDVLVTPAISLNSDPSNLEGPIDLAFHESGNFPDVFVLMSLSEQVSGIFTN